MEHSFNVMRKDLGFNDITVHTLRHTFASRLAQLRVPILNIQQKRDLKILTSRLRNSHLCINTH